MKPRRLLSYGLGALLAVAGGTYWYVFVAGAPQLDAPKPEKNTHLSFQVKSFYSEAMQSERKYGVVLPPEYDRAPQKRYPVIFLLHGGHGTERDFQDKAQLTSVLHDLYRAKKLPPAIVITPDGNDQRGTSPFWDPQYYDGPNGKVGTLIGKELVQLVKSRYRTVNQPQQWAIGGISSGGWGALNIGLRNPEHFHVLFSHSGYFTQRNDPKNSPASFVQTLPSGTRQHLRIYLDAGEQDGEYLDSTQDFSQVLDRLKVAHQFNAFPGGHGIVGGDTGWNYWHKHLVDSLSYVAEQFRQSSKS